MVAMFRQLAVILIALVVPGVALADNAKLVVVLGGPPATYMLPLFMAQAAGLFEKEGITVETTTVVGDQNSMRAILAGSGDIAVVGPPIMYDALAAGAKVKTIVGWQEVTDYFLVLAKGKGTTLKDVAGKTLAVSTPGSMPQIIPEMMFKKNGIDGYGTKYAALGGLAARYQAVIGGKVDGTITDTINALRGERDGTVTLITNTKTQFPEGLGYIDVVARDAQINDPAGRKTLLAFTKASIEGARLITEQPDKAAQVFYEKVGKDVDLPLIQSAVKRLSEFKVWGINGGISPQVHDFTMKTYVSFGLSKNALAYNQVYDSSLVDETLKQIGTR
jgi:NitT/TauT family transport system substrate-binding protein